jgi:hypothetical protein
MPPVGFEPTIPASARPQTYALDRAATGIGITFLNNHKLKNCAFYQIITRCGLQNPLQERD